MSKTKVLAYAMFVIFLCIAPIFAYADDGDSARLIDIPNVEKDVSGGGFTKAIRELFESKGHIVFSEEDMNQAASESGVREGYWKEPDLIKKVNDRVRHDAVLRFIHKANKKSSNLVFYIHNAYTGEMVQDFEMKTQKKGKLSAADKKKIVNAITPFLEEINSSDYVSDIVIKIVSTPEGAEVMRDGVVLGVTPLEYTMQKADTEALEQWQLVYPGREPVMQNISIARSASYNVNIPNITPTDVTTPSSHIGKVKSGFGRPIFSIGFNASPTIRQLKSHDVSGKDVFSYKTQVFATYSFDLSFFPMALASSNDYLQGLGIVGSFGFGFLNSTLQLKNAATEMCTVSNSDGTVTTIRCETKYLRANIDLAYRLLFNKDKESGKLDPNGIFMDFILGYAMSSYTLDENSLYLGHVYHGVEGGIKFSAPLGLDAFRFDLDFAGIYNFNNGGMTYMKKWGTHIDSSWGLVAGAAFSYDLWKGIYFRAGYRFSYYSVQYAGNGCLNTECSSPKEASAKDFYHEIMLGLGYALY